MSVSTGKKVALGVILLVAYFIGKGVNNNQHYDELKSKPSSEWTKEERDFVKKIDDGRTQAEIDRKQYQEDKKRSGSKNSTKPLSEQVLLQNDVIFFCENTARSMLQYPESYKAEMTNSGIDTKNGKKVYYFTLNYSGVNAFNVRMEHTVECYGTIGDKSHQVTYRVFN